MASLFVWYGMFAENSTITPAQIVAGRPITNPPICPGANCPNEFPLVPMGTGCMLSGGLTAISPPAGAARYQLFVTAFQTEADLQAFRAAVLPNLLTRNDFRSDLLLKVEATCAAVGPAE